MTTRGGIALGLVVASLAGCASKGIGGASCSDVVKTRSGPIAKQCVHQIPDGAAVSTGDGGTTIVTLDGKVVATYPPCPCPVPTCTDRTGATHHQGMPWTDGCMACQCGDAGNGTLAPICTHNACPPDAPASGG